MKLESLRKKRGFICDMDGVIYHGNHLLSGAKRFVNWLKSENKKFLFLTNSSERSPRELKEKLDRLGISVDLNHFYTSALATASFLASQRPTFRSRSRRRLFPDGLLPKRTGPRRQAGSRCAPRRDQLAKPSDLQLASRGVSTRPGPEADMADAFSGLLV